MERMLWVGRIGAMIVLGVVLGSGHAVAQETGRVGVKMGYPATVGAVLKVNNRVSAQADVSWSTAHARLALPDEIQPARTTISQSTNWGGEIGAIVFLNGNGNLRPYVSPMYGYSSVSNPDADGPGTHSVKTSFGADYVVSHRFSVFGETGLKYAHQKIDHLQSSVTTTSWGIVSAVGVVLYFH